jgi:hypothetical protein
VFDSHATVDSGRDRWVCRGRARSGVPGEVREVCGAHHAAHRSRSAERRHQSAGVAGPPVFARIRWHDGRDTDVPAIATAWTRDAVEITWDAPGLGLRSDWIHAGDVSRHIPFPEDRGAQRPPDSRGEPRMSGIGPVARR